MRAFCFVWLKYRLNTKKVDRVKTGAIYSAKSQRKERDDQSQIRQGIRTRFGRQEALLVCLFTPILLINSQTFNWAWPHAYHYCTVIAMIKNQLILQYIEIKKQYMRPEL